jgi:hypothetical protein
MRASVILFAAITLAMPSSSDAATRNCGPRSARTVRQSATIRVFVHKHAYFACWRRTPRQPEELGSAAFGPGASVGGLRLRGRYLAYWYASCRATPCQFAVELLDMEHGAAVAATQSPEGRVRTLVATRGGAAAFLADDGRTRFVQKLDSLGVEEIDRGPAVRSLTLHGTRLHWISGTNARDDHIAHVRRCGPIKNARTVALSRNLRAYSIDPGDTGEEFRYYACLLGGGKPMFLGADGPLSTQATFQDDFHLSGDHVVWLEEDCYMDACGTRPHSADLVRRTNRAGDDRQGVPTVYPNRRGFAALLYPPIPGASDYQLLSFDSTGESLLDDGAGIDPESVAVYRDAVVWRDNGEQRSAPLR